MHPGNPGMPPPFNFQRGNSDSEFDSDGDSRRHRGRRESSRHRYVVEVTRQCSDSFIDDNFIFSNLPL